MSKMVDKTKEALKELLQKIEREILAYGIFDDNLL